MPAEPQKLQNLLKNASQSSVIALLVLFAYYMGITESYQKSITEQIASIQKTQVLMVRNLRDIEETRQKSESLINVRLSQLELTNKMLNLPVYSDEKGRMYISDGK